MFRFTLAFLVFTGFQATRHVCGLGLKIEKSEKVNYEAIGKVHNHLDDDRDGEVDISESDEFIRDELKVTDKNRHNLFHGNDTQISVNDLWNSWVVSEVHNWTNAQVISWLVDYVHLPQYVEDFTSSGINGSFLPRLAAQQFNGVFLGIKDPKHRKKISLRAMDVILFGPPPASGHNFIKDIVVAFSVLIATLGCWLAVHQKRRAKIQMDQMMKDLCVLQQAEQNFGELQDRLIKAEEEHQLAIQEKADLEMRLLEEMKSAKSGTVELQDGNKEKLQRLEDAEQELVEVRKALRQAQKELEYQSWRAPPALKEWLQMTYAKESKHFHSKRSQALKQMAEAKEACERIRKKRNSLIGSFRMAHDLTIDEVDQYILKARASLAEVTNELEERQHRWSQIESLCGFQIMSSAMSDPLPGPSGTGSAIAQALASCANIGSVGSGRKLSGATPPKHLQTKSEDLPPTYSSVAVQNSPDLSISRASDASGVDTNGLVSVNTRVHAAGQTDSTLTSKNLSHPCIVNGQDSNNDGSTIVIVSSNGSPKTNDPNRELDPFPFINGNLDSFSGSKHSPTGSKSKKRMSWFGRKSDLINDVELVNGVESEEEKRRKKIKWLWRSAALKSTARPKEQNGKRDHKRDSVS